MIIAFSGIDGSGKSSVASEVEKRFNFKGKPTKLVYIGEYFLLKYPLKLMHFVLKTKFAGLKENPNQNPFLGIKKRPFYVKLWVIFVLVDNWLNYIRMTFWSVSGYTVICDRYFYDKLVGFEYHGYSNNLLSKMFLSLMPMPNYFIVLDITPELANEREVSKAHNLQFYKTLKEIYFKWLPKNHILIKVENKKLKDVVKESLKIID